MAIRTEIDRQIRGIPDGVEVEIVDPKGKKLFVGKNYVEQVREELEKIGPNEPEEEW